MSPMSNPPCITQICLYLCYVMSDVTYFSVFYSEELYLQSSCNDTVILDTQLVFERIVFSDQIFWESLNMGFIWPPFSKRWYLFLLQ